MSNQAYQLEGHFMHQTGQLSVTAPPAGYFITSLRRLLCLALAALILTALIPASALAASRESTAVPSQEASGPPLGAGEDIYGAPADAAPDPAAEQKPQVKDPNATRVREIVEERTESTKTYVLSDGRRQIVDSLAELHYEKAPDTYVDISTNLVAAEATASAGSLATLSTKDKVSFSAKGNGAATLSGDGYSLSFTACGASLSQPLALGDSACYLESGDDTSLTYQALRDGIKETLLINKPKTKDFYDFRMDFSGLSLRQNKDSGSWELIKSDGSVAYGLADLVVTDSSFDDKSGNSSECPNTSWELISSSKTSARFRAHLDKTWLSSKERVWPVKIDPSVTVGVALDTYVGSGYATSNYNSSAELRAGYYDSSTGINRSYIKFNALPNLSSANVDSVIFNAYQQHQYYVDTATTSYVALSNAAIPASATWNNKPAMSAGIASTSIKGRGLWAAYNVTSSLKGPLTTGAAFNGLVLYQSEVSPLSNTTWRKFNSKEGTYPPNLTITYSTKVAPVANLACTTKASDTYFKETDKNGDGIADNKDDYPDAGRGSVALSWKADPYAAGYHIYAYDGANYRQVGTTLGQNATSWNSAGAGFYPTDSTIASYGANGSYSGNPFTTASSPSPATRLSSTSLAYPSGTPFTTGTNGGSNGSGIVIPDGKYIYVKGWGTYKGPAVWVRFTQTNYPSTSPVYGSPVIQKITTAVPQSLCAFVLNGVLYDGAITSSTANSTTIAAYVTSTLESKSTNVGFTFNKPLLAYTSGADVSAGTTGYGVMLTTDGTYIYSVGKSGQGFNVRRFDDKGNWVSDWNIPVANSTAFTNFDSVTSDGNNLYLMEWTNSAAARTYRVSLATHQVTDCWLQSDQATKNMVSFSYDFTSKRFIGGNAMSGVNVDTFRGPGLDLRDNPSPLYNKQKTVYPTNINYWFRVAAYDANGETAIFSASCALPILENRTIRVADDPELSYLQLGSMAGQSIEAAQGRAATHITTTDLAINSYGPDPSVGRTYISDMAATSAYLPKGWRFSFEENMTTLSSGAVQYTDGAGQAHIFAQDAKNPGTYLSPAGMFSTLTKTSGGFTLTDADRTQHSFGSDGKITADIDRNNNKTTYSYPSGGTTVQAANGQKLTLAKASEGNYTLTLEGIATPKTYTYAVSGNNLTVTEYKGTSRQVTSAYTSDSAGRITSLSRGTDSAAIVYATSQVSFAHSTAGAPPAPATVTYAKRSTNVGQATLTKGSATDTGGFKAGQEKYVYLTDPSGQEVWASTSADQLYGTNTTYNAYNQVIATKDPVSASADGLSFANCPESVGAVGATKSDYDSRGNETYSVDKAGLETFNYYNDTNDLIKTISNDRAVTWYDIDSAGQVKVTEKLIAANGARKRTEYTYNAQGLTTVEKTAISKNADGTYVFDEKDYSNFAPNGDPQKTIEKSVQLSSVAAPKDITTSCAIDDCGNTLSNTDGRGITTDTSTYDVAGSLLTSTDKTGLATTNVYNSLGNTTETYQVPAGSQAKYNWTKTTYDGQGNVLSTDALNTSSGAVETTTKTLDVLGREVASDSNSEQGASTTAYDLVGNPTKTVSEGTIAGVVTNTQYDATGQETKSTDSVAPDASAAANYAANVPTTTTYDASGNVISTVTPGQPTTTTQYDLSGNAISSTEGNVTDTSDYDLDGDVVESTQSAPGKPAITTTYVYDLAGNLLSTKMGTQTATTSIYNVRGEMLATTDFDGITTQYIYDEAGNQLSEKISSDNPTTKTFDTASRITSQTNPDGTKVEYTYDILSRISEQKEYQGSTLVKDTTTAYDSAGRVSSVAESVSGYKQAYSYQNVGSGQSAHTVTTKTETFGDGTTQTSVTNGSLFISSALATGSCAYQALFATYDSGGRPLSRAVGSQSSSLSYDDQGNLVTDTALSASGQTYTYDPNDSKVTATNYGKLSQSAAYTYTSDRTQLATAKVGATTTAYAYNATTGDITSAGSNAFTYNSAGRLAARTGSAASYSYDSLGRRTSGAGLTLSWAGQRLGSVGGNFTATASLVSAEAESATITKSSAWYQTGGTVFSGNTSERATTAGAEMTFGFVGTEVHFIGAVNTNLGSFNVYIDGATTPTKTFSSVGATLVYQSDIGKVSGLTQGFHTVRIVTTSATLVEIDRVDVYGSPASVTIWDNKAMASAEAESATITKSSAWYQVGGTVFSGNTSERAATAGAEMTFGFVGTEVHFIGAVNTDLGSFNVYIDGATTPTKTFSSVGAALVYQSDIGKVSGLSQGFHTVRIVTTSATLVEIDRVDVYGSPAAFARDAASSAAPSGNQTSTYSYDGSGQRLSKTVGASTTNYVYDGIKLASLVTKGSGTTQNLTYLYGSGSTPVGARYSSTDISGLIDFQIISDVRGDVRELRDTSGAAFARYDYDAYGNITSSQTFATALITLAQAQAISAAQPLRYAGYVFDSETGLYYCSQRYYDPGTASFISRDPAKADGEKSPYMYCAGEPVGSVDPSGSRASYWSLKSDWAGIAILWHYLYGNGKAFIKSGGSWGYYMKTNKILTRKVKKIVFGLAPKTATGTRKINLKTSMEIENGENIVGYQYLHGTNKSVGGFRIKGRIKKSFKGTEYNMTYTWNDIMDPNPIYSSDVAKAKFAWKIPFARPKNYRLAISWSDRTVMPGSRPYSCHSKSGGYGWLAY